MLLSPLVGVGVVGVPVNAGLYKIDGLTSKIKAFEFKTSNFIKALLEISPIFGAISPFEIESLNLKL